MMDLFSEACGASGPLCFDVQHENEPHPTRWSFPQPFVLVGRDSAADLAIANDRVRPRHSYLQMLGGRVFYIDLEGEHRTSDSGQVSRMRWIDREDAVHIGPFSVRLRAGDQPSRSDLPSAVSREYARMHLLPPTTLEIQSAGMKEHLWQTSHALVLIGKSPACKLRLQGRHVADVHCALVQTRGGTWLVDLLTVEGTQVNGTPVRVARLESGSRIQVGPFSIHFRTIVEARAQESRRPSTISRQSSPLGAWDRTPAAIEPQTVAPAIAPAIYPVVDSPGPASQQLPQAMVMLAQMFGAMHKDHMDAVREELTLIRRLADEIYSLRTELTRPTGEFGIVRPAGGPLAEREDHRLGVGGAVPGSSQPSVNGGGALQSDTTPSAGVGQGNPVAPGASASADQSVRRDPWQSHMIASEFLAAYQHGAPDRIGPWDKILQTLLGAYQERARATRHSL